LHTDLCLLKYNAFLNFLSQASQRISVVVVVLLSAVPEALGTVSEELGTASEKMGTVLEELDTVSETHCTALQAWSTGSD
jgi:hypothetical protein